MSQEHQSKQQWDFDFHKSSFSNLNQAEFVSVKISLIEIARGIPRQIESSQQRNLQKVGMPKFVLQMLRN
jgi:hypothetical protein